MRKHIKLISLILVLAMLCSALAIFVGADETATSAAASEQPDPTATWESSKGSTEILSSDAGNLLASTSLGNWNEDVIKNYLVTEENGNKYGIIVAAADKTVGNHYVHITTGGNEVEIDNEGYLILQLDIATDSEWIPEFTLNTTVRTEPTNSATDLGCHSLLAKLLDGKYNDGDWHRYTVICDFNGEVPVSHVFVDGQYIDSQNGYADRYNADNTHKFTDIRLGISGNKDIKVGGSIAFDNISAFVSGADASYAKAITDKSLAGTELSTAPEAEKLPLLAKVGEVEYRNSSALALALSSLQPVEAEIFRQFGGKLEVNSTATVDTHGFDCTVVAGPAATLVSSADGVYKFNLSASATETAATNANLIASTILLTEDNLYYGNEKAAGSVAACDEKSMVPYIVTPLGSATSYLDLRIEDTTKLVAGTHAHVNWNDSSKTVYQTGAFTVFDFDLYAAAAFIDAYITFTSRNASGNGDYNGACGGTAFYLSSLKLKTGQWNHITLVGDNTNNVLYVFNGNQLVNTVASGMWGAAADGTQAFEGLRLNLNLSASAITKLSNGQSVAVANMCCRLNITDSYLADNIATATSLDNWENVILDSDYEYLTVPPVLTIDGEPCYSLADANIKLKSNDAPYVSILRDFAGTLTINCNATVNTNGHSVTVVPGTDVEYKVNEDGTTTYTSPFIPSASTVASSNTTELLSAIKYQHDDNLLNFFYLVGCNGATDDGYTGMSTALTTNTLNGDLYVDVTGGTGGNTYMVASPSSDNKGMDVIKGSVNNYFILDMDIARYKELNSSFGWYSVCRGTSGCFATNVNNGGALVSYLNALEAGKFQHVSTLLDFDNNISYTFVNGVLVSTQTNGAYGNNAAQYEAGFKFEQFRLFSSCIDSFAVDNLCIRKLAPADAEAVISAQRLAGQNANIYDDSYVGTECAPLLSIDGKYYGSVVEANKALTLRTPVKVEILNHITSGTLTVNCDATVNTNGLTVTVTAGAGVEITSTEGNVTVYDAPFKPSLVMGAQITTPGTALETVRYPADDNLLKLNYLNNFDGSAGKPSLYPATNTVTGDSFLYYETEGAASNSNAYLDYKYSSIVKYDPDNSQYIVYDFDYSAIGEVAEKLTMATIVRRYDSDGKAQVALNGDYGQMNGNNANLHTIVTDHDAFHHITIVYDLHNNVTYYYVDGAQVYIGSFTTEEGHGIFTGKNNPNNYTFYFDCVRIAQNATYDIGIDNMYVRYLVGSEAGNIADAIGGGNITEWDNCVYDGTNLQYPPIAYVNGEYYSTLDALNSALTLDGEAEVELLREFDGKVVVSTDATVITNALDVELAPASGTINLGGTVCAGPLAVITSEDGSTVRFIKLTEANAANYCSTTYWYSSVDENIEEIIYFPYGMQMEYIGEQIMHPVFEYDNYVEDGLLYYCEWLDDNGNVIESLPVASEKVKTAYIAVNITATEVDFSIKNPKVNITLSDNFNVNLYVPGATVGVTEGLTSIDGVDYAKFSKLTPPTAFAGVHTFVFEYDHEGETYHEVINVDVLQYMLDLLDSDSTTTEAKALVLAALNYANEACKLLAGGADEAITEILTTYAQHLPTDSTEYSKADVSALKGIVKGVQLSLESEVAYVINVCDTYEGNITVSYVTLEGETVTKTFAKGETVKVNVKALDLASGIVITAGDKSVEYSLAAYVGGIEAQGTVADFAKALNLYATAAKAYAEASAEG